MSTAKKLLLLVLIIAMAGAFYFLSMQKSKVTQKTTKTVEQKKIEPPKPMVLGVAQKMLKTLELHGFTLTTKQQGETKAYSELHIQDEQKILSFLKTHKIPLNQKELHNLKGLTLALETDELSDGNLSIVAYLLSLPRKIKGDLLREGRADIWEKMQKMLKEQAFKMEIKTDYFKHYVKSTVKDINASLPKKQQFKLLLQSLQFDALLEKELITSLTTMLKTLDYTVGDMKTTLIGFKKHYLPKENNEETVDYNITTLLLSPNRYTKMEINKLILSSKSFPKEGKLSTVVVGNIGKIGMSGEEHETAFIDVNLSLIMDNLNNEAFNPLNQDMIEDKSAFYLMLDNIISHDVRLHITKVSAQDVTYRGKTTDGFTLKGEVVIDHTLPLRKVAVYPKKMAKYLHGKLNFLVSKELVKLIKRDPAIKMVLILMHPKRKFGRRLFIFKFKNGELKVNKISVF